MDPLRWGFALTGLATVLPGPEAAGEVADHAQTAPQRTGGFREFGQSLPNGAEVEADIEDLLTTEFTGRCEIGMGGSL